MRCAVIKSSVVLLGTVVFSFAGAAEGSCPAAYVDFVERVAERTDLSAERLAALHRAALRVFDACDSGHLESAERRLRALENS